MIKQVVVFCLLICFILGTIVPFGWAIEGAIEEEATKQEAKVIKAIEVLKKIASREGQSGAFAALLGQARGIVIFPRLTQVGLGVGVRFGEGIILRRDPSSNRWYGPGFLEMRAASVGPQIGMQEVSLILLLMSEQAVRDFTRDEFQVEAGLNITPGPLGDALKAGFDFSSDVYSYSYSEGLYAGFTLGGSWIAEDDKANHYFYQREISNREILSRMTPQNRYVLELVELIRKISR
ncbi:MAG: hypothetical protein PWP04_1755 [Candidatus Atribacteria bacterium]|nr:hypothetical protein [Candidatus Atribacteria bacterium]